MRELTAAEIEKFASAKGVKRTSVENFLSTLDTSIGVMGNTMNAHMDAQMYKWNSATIRAIEAGIRAASKPKTIGKFGGVTFKSFAIKTKKAKEQVKGGFSDVWESLKAPPKDVGTEIGYYCKKTRKQKRRK